MLFQPGQTGNPGGRPKLSPELAALKKASLEKALQILHAKIHDEKYMSKLSPTDLMRFVDAAFDRFGMPKVTKNEVSGDEGGPLVVKWDTGEKA